MEGTGVVGARQEPTAGTIRAGAPQINPRDDHRSTSIKPLLVCNRKFRFAAALIAFLSRQQDDTRPIDSDPRGIDHGTRSRHRCNRTRSVALPGTTRRYLGSWKDARRPGRRHGWCYRARRPTRSLLRAIGHEAAPLDVLAVWLFRVCGAPLPVRIVPPLCCVA